LRIVLFLPGGLAEELKIAAYADADVFVLPSYAENFGAVVMEALACKAPVVISDRVNTCDEVAKANAGIIVKCTPKAVSEGIESILLNPEFGKKMGENGRKLVFDRFRWTSVIGELMQVYVSMGGRDH